MRQTIRALSWAIIIVWITTLLLPITIGLSLMKLWETKAIGFGEPIASFSNETFTLSAPFYINNTGYYDLSDLNLTILARMKNETMQTFSPPSLDVPAGTLLNSSYNVSFSLEEIASKSMELLTDDTNLNLSIFTSFRVAYVITLGVSTNTTILWKAPFYNLTISEASYNLSSRKFSLSVSFENHAYFPVTGTIMLETYNNRSERIGSTEEYLNVPPDIHTPYQLIFEVAIDLYQMTEKGFVRIYFENVQMLEKEWSLSG